MLEAISARTTFVRAVIVLLAMSVGACGASQGVVTSPSPAASPSRAQVTPTAAPTTPSPTSLAESYLRPLDGVTYSLMSPQVEQQLAGLFTDLPDGYALRDVVVQGSAARLRLVVLHVADKYAGAKILDDQTGFGGRTALPARLTIGGLPAFYHSDVTPNFLVWQQARFLVLIYGSDRPVMEMLAGQLIAANKYAPQSRDPSLRRGNQRGTRRT